MKLYLDNSFLNRPFDDPAVKLNKTETEILAYVLELARLRKLSFVHSSFISYENAKNPFPERKHFVEEIMRLATNYQNATVQIQMRAQTLERENRLHPLDALHLASAETAGVDFFVTCDYTVVNNYRGTVKAVSPTEFISIYERSNG